MESVQLIEDDVTRRSEPALKCLEKAKGGMKRVGSTIGSLLAMSFSRFLGPEVSGKFIILFCFFIVGLLFFYRKVSLKKKSRLFFFIYVSIIVIYNSFLWFGIRAVTSSFGPIPRTKNECHIGESSDAL